MSNLLEDLVDSARAVHVLAVSNGNADYAEYDRLGEVLAEFDRNRSLTMSKTKTKLTLTKNALEEAPCKLSHLQPGSIFWFRDQLGMLLSSSRACCRECDNLTLLRIAVLWPGSGYSRGDQMHLSGNDLVEPVDCNIVWSPRHA